MFPPEADIISEAVYASSQLMDGRRFAEEFLRRRKLADKGIIESANNGNGNGLATGSESKGSSGGWNEVAKKGPVNTAKEEPGSAFKVVAAKKKSGKK